jgi:hypothetical protein
VRGDLAVTGIEAEDVKIAVLETAIFSSAFNAVTAISSMALASGPVPEACAEAGVVNINGRQKSAAISADFFM